jgi:hypothetical protein
MAFYPACNHAAQYGVKRDGIGPGQTLVFKVGLDCGGAEGRMAGGGPVLRFAVQCGTATEIDSCGLDHRLTLSMCVAFALLFLL